MAKGAAHKIKKRERALPKEKKRPKRRRRKEKRKSLS